MINEIVDKYISDSETLIKILSNLITDLDAGFVEQYDNPEDLFCTNFSIKKILETQIFPDIIRCYFIDKKTSERYLLDVETYHGVGGCLKRI